MKRQDILIKRFRSYGFTVIDWQMDDPSVGIWDGWVIYTKEGSEQMYSITWTDAINTDNRSEVVEWSEVYIED